MSNPEVAALLQEAEDYLNLVGSRLSYDVVTDLAAALRAALAREAEARNPRSIWCMHCLTSWEPGNAAEAIAEAKLHELTCEKGPIAEFRREISRLNVQLEARTRPAQGEQP